MSREIASKSKMNQLEAEETALRGMWGIAACSVCGTTIVLGESAGGARSASADLCLACRATPAVAAPAMDVPTLVEDVRAHEDRELTPLPSVRLRDAA